MTIAEILISASTSPDDKQLQKAKKKISAYLLQQVDSNCNDCSHLQRVTTDTKGQATPILQGVCLKFNKSVTFIGNTTQLETQQCFEHRLDGLSEDERVARFMK